MTQDTELAGRESGGDQHADDGAELNFKPWTAEEVAQWRQRQQPLSVVVPVVWQLGVGLLATLVAYVGFVDRPVIAWSLGYGVVAVCLPAWLFARAMERARCQALPALGALSRLMLWEGIKLVLTIALLLAAPRVVKDLSWLALLLGFVVAVKSAWLGWWWQVRASRRG